jgi:hypothetical protein
MKQRLTYFVAFFTLVVFSLYHVPHEVVHAFYDHHDTEHCDNHLAETTVSSIHIHCDFLNGILTDFVAEDTQHRSEISIALPYHYACFEVQTVRSIVVLRDSRGPPLS